MSIEELEIISKVLLGFMFFCFLLAGVMFWGLEINKAWHIVMNRSYKLTGHRKKEVQTKGNLSSHTDSKQIREQRNDKKTSVLTRVLEPNNKDYGETVALNYKEEQVDSMNGIIDIMVVHSEEII